jgi:hypothetical protein
MTGFRRGLTPKVACFAMLAGVSVAYYVRMERGSLAGAAESVLDALADALQLDEAERTHLFALAREGSAWSTRKKRTAPRWLDWQLH